MRGEYVIINVSADMSNEEQIRAYSSIWQDVYQGLFDVGSKMGAHLAAVMDFNHDGKCKDRD